MANTLATISNGKLVSQRALSLLVEQFPFLTSAYSDFSDASARKGDIVTTHLITAATAVAYSTANGYVAGDRTQTDCIVSLDNLIHSTVAINDSEAASSSINLIERFAASAAHAIGKSMVDTLLGQTDGRHLARHDQRRVLHLHDDRGGGRSQLPLHRFDGRNLGRKQSA